MSHYQKPPELYEGLRLHQNENTGGCSPRVLEALSRLRPDQVGFYPPYGEAIARCAQYYGVDEDRVTLVNGLDEGLIAIAMTKLRPAPGGAVPEAIVKLRQGVGRLIRSETDHGVVAILDGRLDTKPYGQTMLQALPHAPILRRVDEVAAFLEAA